MFSQDYRNVTIMVDLAVREEAIHNLKLAFRQLRVISGHSIPENFTTLGPYVEDLYEKFQDVNEAILAVKTLKEIPSTMNENKLIRNRLRKDVYEISKAQIFEKDGGIFAESAISKKK
ncbi:hypothetical protein TSAR_001247 [Trichomalopsis sarcophagae]|uniref:Uncharacterized protein n=1 Tax=Trichomalopsis sarcophagae TaxID=543379 RepID=A0A232EM28_9HYME|nr:hypothetical protein TSAR_001247 [Trichomalopsis sarcophagae]